MTPSLAPTPRQEPIDSIRAAWARYIVLLAGIALIVPIALFSIWPWPYAYVVEQFILPQYEEVFGFKGGPLSVGDGGPTIYGIVQVTPGGRLATAGVRPGDIPVEYHGGLWAFYGALRAAEAGRTGEFMVISESDWDNAWRARRPIALEGLP